MNAPVTYTTGEAVQFKIGERWRDATVKKVKPRASFVEVTIEYLNRGKPKRLLMDAASADLRKWGEGKVAKKRAPMKAWKPPRDKRVRYRRVMPGTE